MSKTFIDRNLKNSLDLNERLDLERIVGLVKPHYQNIGPDHDWLHVQRVTSQCIRLATSENANIKCVFLAALFHDYVDLPKNHPERSKASEYSAKKACEFLSPFLKENGGSLLDQKELDLVSQIIKEHSFSRGEKPSTIEAAILQDADRLDALGAVGILRTASCGVRLNAVYYHDEAPFVENEQPRVLNDKAYTIDHFYQKLLKLKDMMNTPSARALANERHQFMVQFLDQMKSEIVN